MVGRVVALHVAPRTEAPMEARESAELRTDFGLVGDRYAGEGRKGQVTLVSAEELSRAAEALRAAIPAGATRRNITVEGVALPREPGARLRIGRALVEITGPAEPCSVMESSVGPGAEKALRGLAGVRAKVIEGAVVTVGVAVAPEAAARVESPPP